MLVFLFPLMLGNVLQSISMTLNTIFVGRLIGVPGLAAISAFFPVFFLLISFVIGLSSASTVLIGQAHGARDEHRVRKVAGNALSLCILLGIAGAVAGSFVADPLLKAIGTPSDILRRRSGTHGSPSMGCRCSFSTSCTRRSYAESATQRPRSTF